MDVLHDWRSSLMVTHPRLFGEFSVVTGNAGARLTCPGWPEVFSGWRGILDRLCNRIAAALHAEPGARFSFRSIEQKAGILHVTYELHEASETARRSICQAMDLAVTRSRFICEACGAAGHLWDDDHLFVACGEHGAGRSLAVSPHRAGIEILQGRRGSVVFITARRYDVTRDEFVMIRIPEDYDVENRCWHPEGANE
jgi:hypothetical protein